MELFFLCSLLFRAFRREPIFFLEKLNPSNLAPPPPPQRKPCSCLSGLFYHILLVVLLRELRGGKRRNRIEYLKTC